MCAVGRQSDLGELENEAFWYFILRGFPHMFNIV